MKKNIFRKLQPKYPKTWRYIISDFFICKTCVKEKGWSRDTHVFLELGSASLVFTIHTNSHEQMVEAQTLSIQAKWSCYLYN